MQSYSTLYIEGATILEFLNFEQGDPYVHFASDFENYLAGEASSYILIHSCNVPYLHNQDPREDGLFGRMLSSHSNVVHKALQWEYVEVTLACPTSLIVGYHQIQHSTGLVAASSSCRKNHIYPYRTSNLH